MKLYLLYIFLGLAVLPAFGQENTDYYRLPERGPQYNRLLMRYGGPAIQNRWYVSLDGFLRTDRAHLDNTLNGLIESDLVAKMGLGATIGWSYRERWAVEAGYARMPAHAQLSVSNNPFLPVVRYTNNQNAFVLRGKRLILSTSGPWLRSGFWLSGGMWLVPNNGQLEGPKKITFYKYTRETPDIWQLTSIGRNNSQPTTMAEVGAEYNVRLSNHVDLGLSVRRFWGLGNSLTTDLTYSVNQSPVQQAQLQAAGTGMSYGVSLRYTFSLQRKVSNVLQLQGKTVKGKIE